MSKTYRDMVRGRYRAAQKKFDNDPQNKEWLERTSYICAIDRDGHYILDEKGLKTFEKRVRLVFDTKIELRSKRPWYELSFQEQLYVWPYSTPSWFNRMFNNKWKRLQDKCLCRQMTLDYDDEFEHKFYYGNKPHAYYW